MKTTNRQTNKSRAMCELRIAVTYLMELEEPQAREIADKLQDIHNQISKL